LQSLSHSLFKTLQDFYDIFNIFQCIVQFLRADYVDGRLGGPRVKVKERVQDFYTKTPALHELGFVCIDGELRLPFSFDAAKMAEEYPDLRKQMLNFEKIFDKLLKADEHIDKLILGMVPQSAQVAEAEAE